MPLTDSQKLIVDALWEVDAIKVDTSPEGGFKIKAQDDDPTIPNSPFYLNIRTDKHPSNPGPVTDEIMESIGDELFTAIHTNKQGWEFEWFADIPEAGTPFGNQIERLVYENALTDAGRLQLQKKKFGDKTRTITNKVTVVYGDKPANGDRVLLVDDLITKAGTKLEAIKGLEAAVVIDSECKDATEEHIAFTVVAVLVLFDRGSGAADLRKLGYNVVAVMSVLDVIDYLLLDHKITNEEHRIIRNYVLNN